MTPTDNPSALSKLSNESFEAMIAEVEDYAIILLNTTGIIMTWNIGATKIKGYSADEIIGKSFKIFYPFEDLERGLPDFLLQQATLTGKASHEGWRVRKDGARFWGSITITAIHDLGGTITGFLKVTRDLTDRKKTEDRLSNLLDELRLKNEALRQSEDRYHRMISEVRDYAILLLNETGEIQNWNAGAELIKGYHASEIIGKSFRMFYLPEDVLSGVPDRLLEEARGEGVSSTEGWRRRKDGSRFWASVVITALHDEAGNVIGFSKVTRDLSDKKAADDRVKETSIALAAKNHELENLNSELSSFAYVVSHDFKEPIRKIQVFAARQLEDDKSQDQIRDFSKKIIVSAERMQRLMESLLSYSRISNDETKLEQVDLNEVLTEITSDLEVLISEHDATIDAQLLPIVCGVKFQLHQMVLNLISNGIKFKHPGRSPVVSICSKLVSNEELPNDLRVQNKVYHRLTFQDNGIGFELNQKDKIFDVFRRLSPNSNVQGTGIGLSIVKKVATNHRGVVIADSEIGKGASFSVYLPVVS